MNLRHSFHRQRFLVLSTALYLAAILRPTPASAQPVYWDPAAGGNGHYYEVVAVPTGINWWEARLQAAVKAANGRLVTIEDLQLVGGMGAQLSRAGIAHRVTSLGIPDEFGQSVRGGGPLQEMRNDCRWLDGRRRSLDEVANSHLCLALSPWIKSTGFFLFAHEIFLKD